tara:strand:+ start:615 stop:1268 length:654 start_codon:yes stop_codon:yes gene_type:complete
MINVNLKKRFITSISLFILLFLMFIDNLILGYILILIGVFSFLEFTNISKIIFIKKKSIQFFINLIFLVYIFTFCSFFLVSSYYVHLKFLIFTVLITCISSDIGGYVFGKIFKGPKLTKISPNKTVSGSAGSFIFSLILISLIFYLVTNKFDFSILILGFMTSFGCQLGDLFFSFLKRKSYLKDTGNILPGHGGILDRIDGIILGVPVGFATLILLN